MERTIAIIKPDAFPHADSIKNEIQKAGFTIVEVRILLCNVCFITLHVPLKN